MYESAHGQRIKRELKATGATWWGLFKLESRYLPKIIHSNEHIGAIAYGHYKKHESGMLVATDKRVLFIDRKPLYLSASDELSYDVVSGVGQNQATIFSSVTLHTRLGDYVLRLVNTRLAERFVHFIETKRLENSNGDFRASAKPNNKSKTESKSKSAKVAKQPAKRAHMTSDAQAFMLNNELATLSSLDREGHVHGAVVYYMLGEDDDIYIITKSTTHKIHNILANPNVSVTIFDEQSLRTAQIMGWAELETDKNIKQTVFQNIVKPRRYGINISWPPVTKIKEGGYEVIRVMPTEIKLSEYLKNN